MDLRSAPGAAAGISAAPPSPSDYMAALRAALGGDAETPAGKSFVAQIAADVGDDERALLSASDLAKAAADFWAFAARRTGDGPQVRLVDLKGAGTDLQALEVVQDDKPFLVDSVMGEVTEAGYGVRAMFHPVLQVPRDSSGRRKPDAPGRLESLILVLIQFPSTRWLAVLLSRDGDPMNYSEASTDPSEPSRREKEKRALGPVATP